MTWPSAGSERHRLDRSFLAGPDRGPQKAEIRALLSILGIAIGIGVLFGFYPAHRASRMNPIDALRFEV